jgi:uroporphyrinogen decarboxylase
VAESVADLDRIEPVRIAGGPLAEQVEALELIRAGLPDDRPVIMTVFSPLMVLRYCFRDATPAAMAALREDPRRVERALGAIGETLREFCRACIDAGADGMFYATNVATRDLMTAEEVRRFQRPFDLPILQAIDDAPFNMMHVCGEPNHLPEFADYPVACFNWALGPGNLSLVEARELTGKAVVGGVSEKATLREMTPEQVGEQARRAIAETGGRSHLLAPGCSIDFDTPAKNLLAARTAARGA